MGYPFRFASAYEPAVWKHILEYQKKKIAHVYLDLLCSHTSFQKEETFFVSGVKNAIFYVLTLLFTGYFFCLFTHGT
jgi:hypothetical protein